MNVINHALSLILDDPQCAAFTDERAAQMLGRDPQADKDEDTEWWDAKTKAVSELLDSMKSTNQGAA